MSIQKRWEGGEQIFTPTCDLCGAELEDEYDFYDAVDAKKLAGWRSKKIDGEWQDFCPECREKIKQNSAADDFYGIGRG